ncbi:hypothetical protein EYZ11_008258 [Aspergillus tanneri]|uniref:Uncharacterized protein n=1 Tax=Aspergillus tanneri TaxID=1220188 RepID=A0A4S3JAZ6_9EURO|nr:uncharacterized protein ATNIH1004_009803 [Aspergillus tanneri]KAA8643041.1 hypothetical protein ATNIH1004_009803 [Aspergillus tanneri]THC92276.1 hypothetical protein EYZ11_008258 [Aspergillus tanneri]
MVNFFQPWLTSGLLLSLIAQPVLGHPKMIELQEIEHIDGSFLQKREAMPYAGFDRMTSDSLYWGASQDGKSSLAKFTVKSDSEELNIINIEKFRDKLRTVNCTQTSLAVDYIDPASFDRAQQAWNWINQSKNHSLVVIAGRGHCGWNKQRMPFHVSEIHFDKNTQTAKLIGKASEWTEVFQSYDLTIGQTSDHGKRGFGDISYDKDFNIDFSHDLTFSKEIPIPSTDFHIDLGCDSCGTKGSFDIGLHIAVHWASLKTASVTLKPSGVSLDIKPSIGIGGNFSKEIGDEFELATVPLAGISIKSIVEIGPQLKLSAGYGLSDVSGEATVSAGVSVGFDDSASLELDITDAKVKQDGWTPKVKPLPLTVDAEISATAEVYAKAAAELALKVFKYGWEAGIELKPNVQATLKLSESTNGVCSDDSDKHIFGVAFSPSASVSLDAYVQKADDPQNPLVQTTIAQIDAPLDEKCFPFGPKAADQSTTSAAGSKTSSASSTAVPSSSATPSSKSPRPPSSTGSATPSWTPTPSPSAPAPNLHLRDHRRHRRHGWQH